MICSPRTMTKNSNLKTLDFIEIYSKFRHPICEVLGYFFPTFSTPYLRMEQKNTWLPQALFITSLKSFAMSLFFASDSVCDVCKMCRVCNQQVHKHKNWSLSSNIPKKVEIFRKKRIQLLQKGTLTTEKQHFIFICNRTYVYMTKYNYMTIYIYIHI